MRRTWAELRYAATALPIAVTGFAAVATLLLPGLVLAVTFAGLPLLAASTHLAVRLAAVERRRAASSLGLRIAVPPHPRRRPGLAGWVTAALKDSGGWRAVAFTLVKPLTAVLSFASALVFWVGGAAELTYPIWRHLGGLVQVWGGVQLDTWPRSLAAAAVGVLLLVCAPWAVRVTLTLDRTLARALLAPTRGAERMRHLERTRTQAVDDAAATLRRIERDLHDGAQARMVAVTMDLVTARKLLEDGDPHEARELLDLAQRNAGAAVGELRDLARGIHPPALDLGLDTALATLAASQGGIPVEVRVDLPERPDRAVERILYFCATELLANVFKHSRAGRAGVEVSREPSALRLRVHDDGHGGAAIGHGGGLAGLADRLRPLDGRLTITSPPGGPTTAVVELPDR